MSFDEGEHLSLPGTQYRVLSVDPKGYYSAKTTDYVPLITMEEI